MATTQTVLERKRVYTTPTRRYVTGTIFITISLAIWLLFARQIEAGTETTFRLVLGGATGLPDWQFSSLTAIYVTAILSAAMGGYQLARGFGKRTDLVLGLVAGMFIFAFLTWATAGKSLNLAGLINSALLSAVPITLGAFSGVLCERAGVVNIAIEGMMLTGALAGALVGSVTNMWIGLLAAVLAGALLALVHAVLSITYKTDQIVSGTVINIFATGFTSYISAKFMQRYEFLNRPDVFPSIRIPVLSEIPVIGPILFNHNIFIYGLFIFMFLLQFALFYTRWGLRLRSVGEHPKAADTLGINVFRTRYMAVILGGMMAGFGGGYFTVGSVGRFDEVMTAGKGFIGLAAMIFGNWQPFGAFGAGLLFGFADSLASKLAILGINIPSEFLLMTPYVATILVLAGVVGRGQMPAADGQPYEKE
ncbi:MAG TPA: ABC transporter permease [Anaerolineales bacterium]